MEDEENERKEIIRRLSEKWDEQPLVNVCPCSTCTYYIKNGKKSFVCQAYPDGIPDVIIRGEVDHIEPYPGDHGIQYMEKPISIELERFLRKAKTYGDES